MLTSTVKVKLNLNTVLQSDLTETWLQWNKCELSESDTENNIQVHIGQFNDEELSDFYD